MARSEWAIFGRALPLAVMFVAPLVVVWWLETVAHGEDHVVSLLHGGAQPLTPLLPYTPPKPQTAVLWLTFVTAYYACMRRVLAFFSAKMFHKSVAQHQQHLCMTAVWAFMLLSTARVGARIEADGGWLWLLSVAFFGLLYALVFEVARDLRVTITVNALKSPFVGVVVAFSCAVMVAVVHHHLHISATAEIALDFVVWVSIVLCVKVLLLLMGSYSPSSKWHLHHWFWPLIASHICIFCTASSAMAQSIFMALFLHGIAAFGPAPVFYDHPEGP